MIEADIIWPGWERGPKPPTPRPPKPRPPRPRRRSGPPGPPSGGPMRPGAFRLSTSSATAFAAQVTNSSRVTTPSWFASAWSNIRTSRVSVISSRVSLPSLFLSNAVIRVTRASAAAALSIFGALSRDSSGGCASATDAASPTPSVNSMTWQTFRMERSFQWSTVDLDGWRKCHGRSARGRRRSRGGSCGVRPSTMSIRAASSLVLDSLSGLKSTRTSSFSNGPPMS